MSEIRPRDSKYKNIMIAGGGRVGRRLAKILEDKFSVVKIIEKSRKRGDYLSSFASSFGKIHRCLLCGSNFIFPQNKKIIMCYKLDKVKCPCL